MRAKQVASSSNIPPVQPTQTADSLPKPADTLNLIRARAFELYEERGREDGHAEEDWLQAECEILSKQSGKIAA
jgi:hypothetical protein